MADAAIYCAEIGINVYFITVAPLSEFLSGKGKETLVQLVKEEKKINIITAPAGITFEFGSLEYKAGIYKQLLTRLPAGTPVIISDDGAVWEAATFFNDSFPVIGVLHGDDDLYYSLARKYSDRVSAFACVSGRISGSLKNLLPAFPPERIFTIPCGISLPAITASAVTAGHLKLIFVGRVTHHAKRTGDLVKIAAALVADKVDFRLDIIGDGDAKAGLMQAFNDAGLSGYIRFLGWQSQAVVAAHLSASDILLLTSDFEGTPIAMMEAFAAGCGMVGTRVSGVEDYEFHPLAADCLRVYSIGDIPAAVAGIVGLAGVNIADRQHSARKIAESEFSMQVCMQQYFRAIAEISTKAAPPRQYRLGLATRVLSSARAYARYLRVRSK